MKAAVIRKYGKPEVLHIEEMPEPTAKANEIKIKIAATSVNPVDWKIRSGAVFFLTGFKFPRILGGDFSGTVISCGENVKNISVGTEVYGLSPAMFTAGAYAEYMACSPDIVAEKPVSLSHAQAATIPLAASTAYQALHSLGKIKPGMQVLITGCTGGVGHFAVQIAKAASCGVAGVCHSRNAALAKELGCDEVFPYDQTHFTKHDSNYDVIFDAASKDGYWKSKKALKHQGIYISTLPTPLLMLMHGLASLLPGKKAKFIGVQSSRKNLEKLSALCNAGKLKPFIENTFSISDIAQAHALSETEKVRGKISIQIQHI